MVLALIANPKVLVLGLGDPERGDEGIGVRLARSLRSSLRDLEVWEASDDVDFMRLFEAYDMLILLDAICYSPEVGRVLLMSPFGTEELRGPRDVALDRLDAALQEARTYGHRVPRVEIVGVCVSESAGCGDGLSPELAAKYPVVLSRVKATISDLVRELRGSFCGSLRSP